MGSSGPVPSTAPRMKSEGKFADRENCSNGCDRSRHQFVHCGQFMVFQLSLLTVDVARVSAESHFSISSKQWLHAGMTGNNWL